MRASLMSLAAQSIGARRIAIVMATEAAEQDGLRKAQVCENCLWFCFLVLVCRRVALCTANATLFVVHFITSVTLHVVPFTQTLAAEFPEFRKFVATLHVLRDGECAGKSANCSSAFRSLCAGHFAGILLCCVSVG